MFMKAMVNKVKVKKFHKKPTENNKYCENRLEHVYIKVIPTTFRRQWFVNSLLD